MNPDTGKWNEARFNELANLMENESLKEESNIIRTYCRDGVVFC